MRAPRPIPLALALVALVVFIFSGWTLAQRIVNYNKTQRRTLFYLRPIAETSFTYAGRPVEIVERIDDDGRGDLLVRYGEDEATIGITIPVRYRSVPGLSKHSDWMRLLLVREGEAFDHDAAAAAAREGSFTGRAVIVVRVPPPGADPETRGQTARSQWRFDFYQLHAGGGIERLERLSYPESERAFERRVAGAQREGRPPPQRSASELREGTWQYDAAMMVMPPGAGPRRTFLHPALMHWSFAATSVSLLVLIIATGFAFAPPGDERREENRAA